MSRISLSIASTLDCRDAFVVVVEVVSVVSVVRIVLEISRVGHLGPWTGDNLLFRDPGRPHGGDFSGD